MADAKNQAIATKLVKESPSWMAMCQVRHTDGSHRRLCSANTGKVLTHDIEKGGNWRRQSPP